VDFPLAMLSQYIFGPLLFLLSAFITLIILLQRGRGGGLTGALGGAGGASAFGVKAGDIFTRITAISVLLWIVLCSLTCFWYLDRKLDIEADASAISGTNSTPSGGMGGLGSDANLDPGSFPTMPPASNIPAEGLPASPTLPSVTLPPAAPPSTETSSGNAAAKLPAAVTPPDSPAGSSETPK
jgi:preprotein translocase subunit SecG